MTKRITFQTLVAALFTALLFSSCLGDNNSKVKQDNVLAYIKKDNTMQYAAGNNINFTSSLIKELKPYRFYILNCEVSTNNVSGGIFEANSVTLVNEAPIAKGDYRQLEVDETLDPDIDRYKPQDRYVTIRTFRESDFLDDNWAISYVCEVYKEDMEVNESPADPNYGQDNLTLVATLYTNKQKNDAGEALDKNQAIIHLSIKRRKSEVVIDELAKKKMHTGTVSINMAPLRRYFEERGAVKGVKSAIQFHYQPRKPENAEQELKPRIEGSLTEPNYFMVLES